MKKLIQMMALAGFATVLALGTPAKAQEQRRERGNFDPEQMRQRMMERYREALEVKSDDEWKVLEPRITKVSDARREVGGGFGRGFGRPRGGEGGNDQGGGDRRRGGGDTNPEGEALQKAVEAKAPAEEVKAKLAKFREARKTKEANLAKAQDELKKVLSVRQEASAVLMGLLP